MNARFGSETGDDSATTTESERADGAIPRATSDGSGANQPSGSRLACLLALVGAVVSGAAPFLGVVTPSTPSAYPSGVLLVVLGSLPAASAALLLRADRPSAARAVLLATAAVFAADLLGALQLLVEPGLSSRPELLMREGLRPLRPAAGSWLLLSGHAAVVLAGVLALLTPTGEPSHGERGASGDRQPLFVLVLCFAAAGACSALLPAFRSLDPFVVSHGLWTAPPPVFLGKLLLAVVIPVAAGIAVSSADPEVGRGGLLGLATSLAATTVPVLPAVLLDPELLIGWGLGFGLVALLGLAVLSVPVGRTAGPAESARAEVSLPAHTGLSVLTGALAALGGVLAVVACLVPQLRTPERVIGFGANHDLLPLLLAGLVQLVLGLPLLRPGVLAPRAVLGTAWVVVPLAAAADLDTVLRFAGGSRLELAPTGVWLTVAAVVLTCCAAVCDAVAGATERDEVDLSEISPDRSLLPPTVLTGLLVVAAFGFPVFRTADYDAPGLFTGFGIASWGLLTALLVVLGALALVPVSRGARAVAMLLGCALVLAFRASLASFAAPAGSEGFVPGLGLWSALGAVVAAVATAVLVARRDG
ncbi:hypothetical protein SAMN04487905_102155 [Actinopolyspora xinjiangensis]|uniref:Uncharacterized protein n=1 Tax=Actinopolyspora xinjiangensis TaxID=405564 RepID=A0A1H0QCK5_9ACTN|nr:hypothetical protein [Actinopolyspora xinjiangensis]SDP14429.1 hypothetical protein SAMN04487905_102155 [Actinopolyspora xinjiangensis]